MIALSHLNGSGRFLLLKGESMEFRTETSYDRQALTAMAKAVRKTIRKKKSRRSHVFALVIIILNGLLTGIALSTGGPWGGRNTISLLLTGLLLLIMLGEDRLNAAVARKRLLTGTEKATCIFSEEGYASQTAAGNSQWNYQNIAQICETERYMIFVFPPEHGQVFDKSTLAGGTIEEFRNFLEEKTGKKIYFMK